MKTTFSTLARSLILVIASVVTLVGCSNRTPDPQSLNESGNLVAQAATPVLILWDDSVTAASGSGVSFQGKTKIGTVQLKPGMANLEEGQRNREREEKKRATKTELVNPNSVSSQAFSYTDSAQLYALMLANLLGRYNDVVVTRKPISQYLPGDTSRYFRTFYLASTYENQTPAALVADIQNGGAVTWLNYNYWHLDTATVTKLGFHHVAVRPEYSQAEYSIGFNKVDYQGYTYNKYPAPMEIMEVSVDDPNKVSVQAWAKNAAGTQIPYAIKSGNFWFIADNPFSYMHETDRYLVFADLIGPMMSRDVSCAPKALARLEDISPNHSKDELKRMLDALKNLNIPFTTNVIPLYQKYDAITNTTTVLDWKSSSALSELLRIPSIKGQIFQHGYTHQYENLLNPYGETGDDFEFWRVTLNADGSWNYVGPIPGLTPAGALTRVQTGRSILSSLSTPKINMSPVGWTTPHYASDPDYYPGIKNLYSRVWERRLYRVGGIVAGQFFPYPVRDVTGQLILPENMGSIEPTWPASKIVEIARANRALRCPWAGHFFHTYIIDPTYTGTEALKVDQFKKMFKDIISLGYSYQDSTTVTLQ